ncbi:GNAT family N-acetyltransferase [Mesorhizobium sp. B2-5-13]|uniref:GNAT family N-acetyltransferase n=1 Tax=unclassified Mesorhizobium TaxID=325217 RepID=UPI001127DC46|nr:MULTISPECIES: GNAT family N-acetyltransferase [unclassified Mesorhizobium]TPJ36673.1 GNAT family N-acetyltransferase [Mesorhizobium sp. B2-6-5]TPJ77512.1 GNAT family N-acetyltransferase [Mesorhizobium sp. B2-5-13]TPK43423.1 GNAT family N-acetyltransferase [Mesorhizobium sp. B2-5-5]
MAENAHVLYAREPTLGISEFRRVLVESGLGEVRPVDDEARLKAMMEGANLIVTARLDMAPLDMAPLDREAKPLIGVARCLTDFSWVCYISDLAVSAKAQGLGIGKGLMDEVARQLGPSVAISLISMPDAVGFYERIGMKRMPDAFWISRKR